MCWLRLILNLVDQYETKTDRLVRLVEATIYLANECIYISSKATPQDHVLY
jgi:hypothetical protein